MQAAGIAARHHARLRVGPTFSAQITAGIPALHLAQAARQLHPPALRPVTSLGRAAAAPAGAGASAIAVDMAALAPVLAAAVDTLEPQLQERFRSLVARRPRIVLGSQSQSRRAILDELAAEYGFSYATLVAGIDESAIRHDDAHTLVLALAHAKADAILARMPPSDGGGEHGAGSPLPAAEQQQPPGGAGASAAAVGAPPAPAEAGSAGFLITCDQVVLCGGVIREKPADKDEARRFMESYNQLPAETCGSVVVVDLATRARCEGVDTAQVHFSGIPGDVMQALVDEGEVMWCAGGLMVEHAAVQPYLTKVVGSLDSVMGLPKRLVVQLLVQAAGL